VEANTTGSMKTLLEGLFPKDRLLSYIRASSEEFVGKFGLWQFSK